MSKEIITTKSLILKHIQNYTEKGLEISRGLLGYLLHEYPERIVELVQELRQEGFLIIENQRGYFRANDIEQYRAWRTKYMTDPMLAMVKTLQGMQDAAREQFGETDVVVLAVLNRVEVESDGQDED